jgi:hypothetical protein
LLEKSLKIICENANLSAQLFLVLCGKVSTLKRGFELENRASSHAQTARGRSELFTALPGYSSVCACNREGSIGIISYPHRNSFLEIFWNYFPTVKSVCAWNYFLPALEFLASLGCCNGRMSGWQRIRSGLTPSFLPPHSIPHSCSLEELQEKKSSPLLLSHSQGFVLHSSERASSRDRFESSKRISSLSSPFPWLVLFGERS